jgi:hypothetical protein
VELTLAGEENVFLLLLFGLRFCKYIPENTYIPRHASLFSQLTMNSSIHKSQRAKNVDEVAFAGTIQLFKTGPKRRDTILYIRTFQKL